MNMLQVINAVVKETKERNSDPFLGPFLLFFMTYNWKLWIFLFGLEEYPGAGESVGMIAMIESVLPSEPWKSFGFPALFTFLYTTIYQLVPVVVRRAKQISKDNILKFVSVPTFWNELTEYKDRERVLRGRQESALEHLKQVYGVIQLSAYYLLRMRCLIYFSFGLICFPVCLFAVNLKVVFDKARLICRSSSSVFASLSQVNNFFFPLGM